jgi:hypothetical protein
MTIALSLNSLQEALFRKLFYLSCQRIQDVAAQSDNISFAELGY